MAGAANDSGDGLMSGINVTPLVDITLVLLVVFLVTAKVIAQSAIQVDLPTAATAQAEQTILHVTVTADGVIHLDDVAMNDDEAILGQIRATLAKDAEARAVIDADGKVEHARVIHVMDLLRRVGLTHLAFGVEPEVKT